MRIGNTWPPTAVRPAPPAPQERPDGGGQLPHKPDESIETLVSRVMVSRARILQDLIRGRVGGMEMNRSAIQTYNDKLSALRSAKAALQKLQDMPAGSLVEIPGFGLQTPESAAASITACENEIESTSHKVSREVHISQQENFELNVLVEREGEAWRIASNVSKKRTDLNDGLIANLK